MSKMDQIPTPSKQPASEKELIEDNRSVLLNKSIKKLGNFNEHGYSTNSMTNMMEFLMTIIDHPTVGSDVFDEPMRVYNELEKKEELSDILKKKQLSGVSQDQLNLIIKVIDESGVKIKELN